MKQMSVYTLENFIDYLVEGWDSEDYAEHRTCVEFSECVNFYIDTHTALVGEPAVAVIDIEVLLTALEDAGMGFDENDEGLEWDYHTANGLITGLVDYLTIKLRGDSENA